MANVTNKAYVIYGENGEELKTLKSLAAAKKLADSENGSVLVDGECVYKAAVDPVIETVSLEEAEQVEEQAAVEPEVELEVEPVEKDTKVEEKTDKQKYRLLSLMNIRSKPSMKAPIIGQVRPGTVVIAQSLEEDWLNTADGFILYGQGKYAEKV